MGFRHYFVMHSVVIRGLAVAILFLATVASAQTTRSADDHEVAEIEQKLADYDKQIADALKDYLPTSKHVVVLRKARSDHLEQVEPRLVQLLTAAEGELAELGKELRPTAAPMLAKQAQIDRLRQLLFTFTNSHGMKFVRISPGTFMMGSPADEEDRRDDEVQHQVTLTKPYYMAVHHVTRGQFAKFVAETKYETDIEKKSKGKSASWSWRQPLIDQDDNHPVVDVSWNDAVAFTEWLSRTEHRPYRLPTEAEWEYACRAGTTTPFNTGATISTDQANYNGDKPYGNGPKGVHRGKTTAVGTFPANNWGLFDMHGNAWQWCSDVFGSYAAGSVSDPTGPAQHRKDVRHPMRGGSWVMPADLCRSAFRDGRPPDYEMHDCGFRVVLDSP